MYTLTGAIVKGVGITGRTCEERIALKSQFRTNKSEGTFMEPMHSGKRGMEHNSSGLSYNLF